MLVLGGFKSRQAERLKYVITEKGIDQQTFAKKFGFSTVSVSHWMTGQAHMREDSAELINKTWPEYPVNWLRGISDSRTPQEAFYNALSQGREETAKLYMAFGLLADLNGYSVSSDYYNALESGSIERITQAIDESFVTIEKNGKSASLGMDDFYELTNQISDNADMRLLRLVNRGKW